MIPVEEPVIELLFPMVRLPLIWAVSAAVKFKIPFVLMLIAANVFVPVVLVMFSVPLISVVPLTEDVVPAMERVPSTVRPPEIVIVPVPNVGDAPAPMATFPKVIAVVGVMADPEPVNVVVDPVRLNDVPRVFVTVLPKVTVAAPLEVRVDPVPSFVYGPLKFKEPVLTEITQFRAAFAAAPCSKFKL